MTEFVHTHVHSQFSLLDGAAHLGPLIKAVKGGGMNAVAVTDHGNLHGTWQFYNAAKKAGIKPILGMEGYIVDDVAERSGKMGDYSHLLLFAEDYDGYRNLMRLTTESYRRGFYYKPRIDWAMLEQYSKGLIVTSGCLAGQIPQAIQAGDELRAERLVHRYLDLFGRDRFYIEVQDHDEPDSPQVAVNRALYDLARHHDLPLLATNDSHYVAQGDAPTHDMMLCVQMGKSLEDEKRMRFGSENYYIKTPAEMAALFSGHEDALRNTLVLAERCNVVLPTKRNLIPVYEPPEGYASDADYLYKLCEAGIGERYGAITEELRARLDREFEVIRSKGFVPYFLIVWDYVNYARSRGAGCVARGSVAGSIVAYALGLSSVEPIRFGLPFERFLNPERDSMPDIDMDFPDDRREEIIRYVANKYGWDHVAQIATFNTMAAKAAVRDAGRVLNLRTEADRVSRLIPSFPGTKLVKAVGEVPDLQKLYTTDHNATLIIDAARGLEGTIRATGIHAAGVIISREPVYEVVPCMVRKADQGGDGDDVWLVTQHEQHDCEEQDLLKMDFLGLAALSTVRRCRELIKESRGQDVDIARIPHDDAATFALLSAGDTTGVFQLEGAHMRMYIQDLKPTRVEDVMAMVALYRPGPMDSIPTYIKAKHGLIKPSYLHPKLEPILRDTYGVIVYQDQVLRVALELAGFTWGEVDKFRKAMGKKIAEEMHAQREKFISGCLGNGIEVMVAESIWTFIEPFAGYGFNMAHAASYGLLAYQTAYLKAHYRAEFMAASLTTEAGDKAKVARLIRECDKRGVPVLPPDVNKSKSSFSVERTTGGTYAVRVGLSGIAGLGTTYLGTLLGARHGGEFASLADIFARCTKITSANVSALIKAGACDAFGSRSGLLETVEQSAKTGRAWRKKHVLQDGLFSNVREHVPAVPAPDRATKKEMILEWEFEALGFYLTEHPLLTVTKLMEGRVTHTTLELASDLDGESITLGGRVAHVKRIVTKRTQQAMAQVQFEDIDGLVDCVVFPKVFERTQDLWKAGKILYVTGEFAWRDGEKQLSVERAELFSFVAPRDVVVEKAPVRIEVLLGPAFAPYVALLPVLRGLINTHKGDTPYEIVAETGRMLSGTAQSQVKIDPVALEQALVAVVGEGKARVKQAVAA